MIKPIIVTTLSIFLWSVLLFGQNTDQRKAESQYELEERFLRAKYLQISGKQDEAYKLLDTLRKENKNNGTILFEMAKIRYAAGDFGDAESLLIQAVKLEPQNQWFKLYYAEMCEALSKYEEAASIYNELISQFPKNQKYYDALYTVWLKAKNYPQCLATLDKVEQQLGFSEQIIFKRAELLDNTGKVNEAVRQLERLVAKYPGQPKYVKLIAAMLKSNGMDKEAIPYYRKILESDPSDAEARIAVLAFESLQDGPAGYLQSLEPMMQNPDIGPDLKVKELMPYVIKHAETSDPMLGEKLRQLGRILVQTHPNDAKAYALYGDVLMNSGEIRSAVAAYHQTLQLNDRNYMVWEQLMFGLKSLQDYPELAKTAEQAIDLFPNFPMPYYFAGMAALEEKHFKKAYEYLSEALSIASGDAVGRVRILTGLAQLRLQEKKWKEAHAYVNEALQITGSKDPALIELQGDIFFAESDVKSAVAKWRESLQKGNKSESILIKLEKSGAN